MDRKIMFCWAMVVTMRVSDAYARGRRGMGIWKVTKSMLEYTIVLYELFLLVYATVDVSTKVVCCPVFLLVHLGSEVM